MRLLDDDALRELKINQDQQLKKFEFLMDEEDQYQIDPELLLTHQTQMQYEMKADLYKLFELQDHYLEGSVNARTKVKRGISECIKNICSE